MASRNAEPFDLLSGQERAGNPDADSTPELVTSTPQREAEVSGNLAPPRRRSQLVVEDTTTRQEPQPVDAMVALANSLNGLLQQFTTQVEKMNSRKERPTKTFAGHIYENPAAFARYMDDFFRDNGVGEDNTKIDIFRGQLRDAAKAWARAFDGVPLSYRAFEESFLRQYNSNADKISAISLLYGEKQKVGESAEVFLTKKRSLFARVNPQLEESAMAEVLHEQLLPPIKSRLRNSQFEDILDLIHQAVRAESDAQEEAAYWSKVHPVTSKAPAPPRSGPPPTAPSPRPAQPNQPPTPCRFCKGWHFHRDCPVNPYRQQGNSSRVPEQRGREATPPGPAARNSNAPRPAPRTEQPVRQRPNQITVATEVDHSNQRRHARRRRRHVRQRPNLIAAIAETHRDAATQTPTPKPRMVSVAIQTESVDSPGVINYFQAEAPITHPAREGRKEATTSTSAVTLADVPKTSPEPRVVFEEIGQSSSAADIQEYNYTVEHCPASKNQFADYLSRNPTSENAGEVEEERLYLPANNITQVDLYNEVKEAQPEDRTIANQIIRHQAAQRFGADDAQEQRLLEEYAVEELRLYKKTPDGNKLVVPDPLIAKILYHHHDTPGSAHPGYEETLRQIQRRYHFTNMRRTVQDYVRNCLVCAAVKPHRLQPRAPMKPHSPQAPFEMLSIDILGPYHETVRHNKYVLMAEDVFTKWVEAAAVPVADVNAIIQFLETEIFARYGYPKTIISDNARIFQADKYLRLCRDHGITVYYSPIYHQRSNPVERRVQEFKKIMRALLFSQRRRRNWDRHLHKTLHVLRGRTNSATGMSPSEALLGYKLPREGEWEIPEYIAERNQRADRQSRLDNIRRRQLEFQQQWYDQQRRPQVTFRRGQRVMTREGAPLKGEFGDAWSGPHTVLRKLSDEVYEIEKSGSVARTHVDDIRPAPLGNRDPNEADVRPEEPGGHEEEPEPAERDDTAVERDPEHGEDVPDITDEQPPPATEVTGPTYVHRGRRVRLVTR